MSANDPSIFDLSPAEKLQLVQDLWDDLAATPEVVPVHEWQKEELARRKAHRLRNPGIAGTRVVRGTPMNLTLEQFGIDRLTPEQRYELIELIWDSLPDDAPFTPPDWHLRELEKRVANADANPGAGEPWEVVRARISRKS